jgi:3-oxoacyl-[acyl-carrier protein] reductase
VTGAGRGIGRAIALKLASEGANIVVNELDEAPGAEVVREIRQRGARAALVHGDVTAPDFGTRFVAAALEHFGTPDIIVNNAGYIWDNVIQKTVDEQFEAMLALHVTAPFRILRAAAEPIRAAAKREAAAGQEVFRKVVNISSLAGLCGSAGQSGYSSGKAAIVGLTKTLAKEWGRYKVNVNCVAFGFIHTRLTAPIGGGNDTIEIQGRAVKVGIQPQYIETLEQLIPIGRAGSADEAAGAVYLFCAPESNYVSGQVLACAGGLYV